VSRRRGPQTEADLWAAYRARGGVVIGAVPRHEARNALVVHYLPLARRAAGAAYGRQHPVIYDREELASFGSFGLVRAVERYDPARQTLSGKPLRVEVYVWHAVSHSIAEEVRRISKRSRGDVNVWRRVRDARAHLADEGSPDDSAHLAAALGVGSDALPKLLTLATSVASAELHWEPLIDGGLDAPSAAPGPADLALKRREPKLLRAAIARLPAAEAEMILLVDFELVPQVEMGRRLGLSESRISQIHTKAVAHLRRLLAADERV